MCTAISRRTILAGTAASAAAVLLAACGGSKATDTPKPVGTTGAATTASSAAVAATKPAGSAVSATTAPAATTSTTASGSAAVGTTAASGSAPAGTTAASTGTGTLAPMTGASAFKGKTLGYFQKVQYYKAVQDGIGNGIKSYATSVGASVDLSLASPDTGTNVQKVQAGVQNGSPFDFADDIQVSPQQLITLGLLTDVTALTKQLTDAYGTLMPIVAPGLQVSGKFWAIPYFTSSDAWFVRKDWCAAKGIDPATLDTYEKCRDAALAISDPSKNQFGWGFSPYAVGDAASDITHCVNSYGGSIQDKTGTKVVWNSPETVAAITFYSDIYTNPKYKNMLPPGVNGWTDTSNNEAWLAGTLGITQNAYTLYAQSFATKNPVYDQTAIAPGYIGPATEQVIATPGAGYLAVPKGAKNPDLARATALHLIGGPAFLNLAKPSLGLIMPVYKNLWNADPFYTTGDPSFPALRTIIEGKLPITTKTGYKFPFVSPIYEQGVNGQHILNDMMGSIIQKGVKPADAVKAAHDQLVQAAVQLGLPQ
ncbi:MAG: ABC transporter substrate-binding protein [Chloroflexota bacterium]|nr:ABC transporter substrate-binding protein [Chloroflexota bacterium]